LYSCITNTLKEYSKIHFITEEAFLELAKYEDIENHKRLHEKLTMQIDIIERKGLIENDVSPLLDFLKQWWINHINVEDKKYVAALRRTMT